MKKNNHLLYGLGGVILGLICMKWMKEDVFRVLGLFDVTGKTFGIMFLVFGGWHLLVEITENDDLANFLESMIRLPFRILGWLLQHWYLVLAVVLVLNWKSDREDPPVSMETVATQTTQTTEKINTDYVHQPYPGMRRNAGACKNLTRDAQVLLAFVDDNESSWTQEEMNQFVADLVDPALGYIEYYAGVYGHTISLESCVYFDEAGNYQVLHYDGILDGSMGTVLSMDLWKLGSESHGHSTNRDWLEDLRAYAGTDQVAVMFCLNKPGRSFASAEKTRADAVESAVVYTEWKGERSRASVFAHELLHLFGAEDLYAEGDQRVNRAALANQLHPSEMHLVELWNLYDHVVGGYNAYAVGWLDALPAEYDCPEWWS